MEELNMKKIFSVLLIVFLTGVILAGCASGTKKEEPVASKLKVGVTAGPHEAILGKVKALAADQGIEIEIIVFNDYVQPNIQLADKYIDINSFQHEPYLNKFKADRNLKLVKIGNTVNFPMGIYSNKVQDVSQIKDKAKIGLPNDPTNQARSLILFESAGLIALDKSVGISATLADITENPRNLEFIELEAPIILRTLSDLEAAAINTNFIIDAGLSPVRDSIFIEPKDSPWVNIIVVREGEENNPLYKKFVEIYNSDQVKSFIAENFGDSVVAAW